MKDAIKKIYSELWQIDKAQVVVIHILFVSGLFNISDKSASIITLLLSLVFFLHLTTKWQDKKHKEVITKKDELIASYKKAYDELTATHNNLIKFCRTITKQPVEETEQRTLN